MEKIFLNNTKFNDDETLIFTGTAETMFMVFLFVKEFGNNKTFKNVKVNFTKTRRQKNKGVAGFGLTLSMKSGVNNA